MSSLTALEARTTALEYAVFEQFPHTMEAMTIASTQIYAATVENGEAIAGLRVDMAALHTSLHRDIIDLRAALDLQGDSLRKGLGVATASFRGEMTGFRETMSLRFQKVDGQFNGVHGEIANLQQDVTGLKTDVTGLKGDVDERFDALDTKIDMLIAAIQGGEK
jgi:hypothetical protein